MVLAAYLLARAEGGELPAAVKFSAARPATLTQLTAIRQELERWGITAGQLLGSLRLFTRAGLLVRDEGGKLRPTPAYYQLVQFPPATICRYLLENSGTVLSLPRVLVEGLLTGGIEDSGEYTLALDSMMTLGLVVEARKGVFRAISPARKLVQLLARVSPTAPTDDPVALELGAAWNTLFPGNYPARGWLSWQEEFSIFSFPRPEGSKPLTFNLRDLAGLLDYCQPIALDDSYFRLSLDKKRVIRAYVDTGKGILEIKAVLNAVLSSSKPFLPIKEWLAQTKVFRVRSELLLEVPEPADLRKIVADKRLRPYLTRIVSARFATLNPRDLTRFSSLLERRGVYVGLDGNLREKKLHQYPIELIISRRQLRELLGAMQVYYRARVEQGLGIEETRELINLLEQIVTGSESKVAESLAETVFLPALPDNPEAIEYKLESGHQVLEYMSIIIAGEKEVLIEYSVPSRQPEQRWILPLLLWEESGIHYLRAYCKLRKEERTFRLDRLKVLESEN